MQRSHRSMNCHRGLKTASVHVQSVTYSMKNFMVTTARAEGVVAMRLLGETQRVPSWRPTRHHMFV